MCLIGCSEVSRRTVIAGLALVPAVACAKPRSVEQQGIETLTVNLDRDGAKIDAFVALPKNPASAVVAVLHGNPGIPADVKDTAIWAASLGYAGLAVNPTARYDDLGAHPRTFWLGTEYIEQVLGDTRAGVARLRADKRVGQGKTAVFGYCGGGYTGLYWGASPYANELDVIVGAHVATRPLRSEAHNYRRPNGIDLFRRASVPIQLHQGGADDYTPPEDLEELRRVAAEMRKPLELHVYPGADHGFAMHTNSTYRPDYAEQVQARAAVFLKRHLG